MGQLERPARGGNQGAGFIGSHIGESHIVDALVDVGAETLVVDDLSRGTQAS